MSPCRCPMMRLLLCLATFLLMSPLRMERVVSAEMFGESKTKWKYFSLEAEDPLRRNGQKSWPPKCANSSYPPSDDPAAPWFDVDLDEKPETRWNHILKPFKDELQIMLKILPMLVQREINKFNPNMSTKIFYDKVFDALPADIQSEMEGIVESHSDIFNRNTLIAANLVYETLVACTSIVAKGYKHPCLSASICFLSVSVSFWAAAPIGDTVL